MKIAIDCRFVGKSGIGTYIKNVVDELLRHHPEHKYLLVVEKGVEIHSESNEVQIIETDIKPFSIKEMLSFPVSGINKCDAFFSPYINIPGGINVPIYSTVHDMVFFDCDGIISLSGKVLRWLFYKRVVNKSEKIFTVSNFSKQRILYHFPTQKHIEVVFNGVSNAIIEICAAKTFVKKDYFIYVGNIKKHKGLHVLVDAYVKARAKGLTSRMLIVGSIENFRTSDKNLTKIIERTEGIELTGWVSTNKLIDLIAEAKALIQPSFYEGFGIPPLEAIYLNTDVILSDIPVFKELYSEIPNCFFKVGDSEDLANKLINFKDKTDYSAIKKQLLDKYSYKKTADKILDVIIG